MSLPPKYFLNLNNNSNKKYKHTKLKHNEKYNKSNEFDIKPFIKINNDLFKLKKKIQEDKNKFLGIDNKNKSSNKNYTIENSNIIGLINYSPKGIKNINNSLMCNNVKYENNKFNVNFNDDDNNKFLELKKKLEILNNNIRKKHNNFNNNKNENEKLNLLDDENYNNLNNLKNYYSNPINNTMEILINEQEINNNNYLTQVNKTSINISDKEYNEKTNIIKSDIDLLKTRYVNNMTNSTFNKETFNDNNNHYINFFQVSSFNLFIKQKYSHINNLNTINELKNKIQQLENELNYYKEKMNKYTISNDSKLFKILNICRVDSFYFNKQEKDNNNYNDNNTILDNNEILDNEKNFSEGKIKNKYELKLKRTNKSFFLKKNLFKDYFNIKNDNNINIDNNLNIKNNESISTSHNTIYKKKLTISNLKNNYNNSLIKTQKLVNNNISSNFNMNYQNINNNNYNEYDKIYSLYYYSINNILSFSLQTKKFHLHEYIDTCSFKKNLIQSNNGEEKDGNIFLNSNGLFYIITGEKYNMCFIFNPNNKTMKKLANLNFNHCNGNLIYFNKKIFCISGDYNKKVEEYSPIENSWSINSELNKERSNFGSCIFNEQFLFLLFGYNALTNEYIDSIEYIDLLKGNSKWNYLEYQNNLNYSLTFRYINAIPFNGDKIIIFGGYNNKEEEISKIYVLELDILKNNINNNHIYEKLDNKLCEVNVENNRKFLFNCNFCKYDDIEQNIIYYAGFDLDLNVHILKDNFEHEIYNFQ